MSQSPFEPIDLRGGHSRQIDAVHCRAEVTEVTMHHQWWTHECGLPSGALACRHVFEIHISRASEESSAKCRSCRPTLVVCYAWHDAQHVVCLLSCTEDGSCVARLLSYQTGPTESCRQTGPSRDYARNERTSQSGRNAPRDTSGRRTALQRQKLSIRCARYTLWRAA